MLDRRLLAVLAVSAVALVGCSTATAAPDTRPSPDAADSAEIKAVAAGIHPDLEAGAVEAARSLCHGEGVSDWQNSELLKGVQTNFADPVGVTLTRDEAQAILVVTLNSFCHA